MCCTEVAGPCAALRWQGHVLHSASAGSACGTRSYICRGSAHHDVAFQKPDSLACRQSLPAAARDSMSARMLGAAGCHVMSCHVAGGRRMASPQVCRHSVMQLRCRLPTDGSEVLADCRIRLAALLAASGAGGAASAVCTAPAAPAAPAASAVCTAPAAQRQQHQQPCKMLHRRQQQQEQQEQHQQEREQQQQQQQSGSSRSGSSSSSSSRGGSSIRAAWGHGGPFPCNVVGGHRQQSTATRCQAGRCCRSRLCRLRQHQRCAPAGVRRL
jgi:hypothetical protein